MVSRILNPDVRKLMQQQISKACSEEPYNYDRTAMRSWWNPATAPLPWSRKLTSPFCATPLTVPATEDRISRLPSKRWRSTPVNYEMNYIFNDDGFGINTFIPERPDVDGELLAMCVG
ncbi:hypothetical protein [Nitrosomonas communis]|uniref:hypothetical protein n=1 Tax=Nitrosomonas communis TaxID=44574 RepID=UPI0011153ECD|nr:hypothetical protein [Nitrosomonas communis]